MQMKKQWRGQLYYWTVLLLLASIMPAAADVTIRGNVQVWNPITNAYEPLKQARVRVVLAEYWDWDTWDVETRTDNNGNYTVRKGSPWWRDGYEAYLIVFAEVDDKLEVQSHYMQVDGYQAVSNEVFARNNRTTTIDLRIGGQRENVRRYQVGGTSGVGADSCNRTQGYRAFFILHEMTDHRLRLVNLALDEGDFEEKEVSYPADTDVGKYIGVLDYIRFPDRHFDEGYNRVSEVCRHELSHGIMADAYIAWPGWWHLWDYPREHQLTMEWDDRDFAWSEAWADFLSQVTQSLRYGQPCIDFESLDADWRKQIRAGADHSRIEGEIAGALWDIYDGVGWEKRYEQVEAIPGEERFYDGIADPYLSKIWHIFKTFRPYYFTHDRDSFVWYWLNRTGFAQRHELKAILFNRGIRVSELPQNPPSVTITKALWYGGQEAIISVEVRERDNEDREHIWLEIYLNGAKVETARMAGGWNGDRRDYTFVIRGIDWRKGQPYPTVLVAAHDDMQSGYVQQTLTPSPRPKIQVIVAWAVELLGVSVRNFRFGFPSPELRNLVLNVQVSDGRSTRNTRLPSSGSWRVEPMSEFRYTQATELFRTSTSMIWDSIELNFTVKGNSDGQSLSGSLQKRYRGYSGNGTHNELIPVNLSGIQVEVVYRIRGITEDEAKSEKKAIIAVPASQLFPPALEAISPIPSKPIPGLQRPTTPSSPTAILSRASRLIDEYARLQVATLEIAEELEWKLSPERLPQIELEKAGDKAPQKPSPQAFQTAPRLLKPELLTKFGLLQLPPTPFLDRAVQGQGLVAKLPTTAQANLKGLNAEVEGAIKRIAEICNEAEQLRNQINQAINQLNATPNLEEKAKQTAIQRLNEASERLTQIGLSAEGFRSVLKKELQVIQRCLSLVK